MRKVLLFLVLIFSAGLIFPENLIGASCPSSPILCSELDDGDCPAPCEKKIVEHGGPGGRGGGTQPKCACVVVRPSESLSCGAKCYDDSECPVDCSNCWGEFHSEKYCHQETHAESLASRQSATGTCDPGDDGRPQGIDTAIGCIHVDTPEAFVESIMSLALGIAGGIAFLLIVYGSIQILASSGNPEKIQGGKELITAAIAGLLLIIFAVFILRLIGKDILGIPGIG